MPVASGVLNPRAAMPVASGVLNPRAAMPVGSGVMNPRAAMPVNGTRSGTTWGVNVAAEPVASLNLCRLLAFEAASCADSDPEADKLEGNGVGESPRLKSADVLQLASASTMSVSFCITTAAGPVENRRAGGGVGESSLELDCFTLKKLDNVGMDADSDDGGSCHQCIKTCSCSH